MNFSYDTTPKAYLLIAMQGNVHNVTYVSSE